MYNYNDFKLYEELQSIFELEGNEMLTRLSDKLPEICGLYNSMDCFISCPSGDVLVIMNDYQKKIYYMFSLLIGMWKCRN